MPARDNPPSDDETPALEPVCATAVTWDHASYLVWLKEIADLLVVLLCKWQLFASHDWSRQLGVR